MFSCSPFSSAGWECQKACGNVQLGVGLNDRRLVHVLLLRVTVLTVLVATTSLLAWSELPVARTRGTTTWGRWRLVVVIVDIVVFSVEIVVVIAVFSIIVITVLLVVIVIVATTVHRLTVVLSVSIVVVVAVSRRITVLITEEHTTSGRSLPNAGDYRFQLLLIRVEVAVEKLDELDPLVVLQLRDLSNYLLQTLALAVGPYLLQRGKVVSVLG